MRFDPRLILVALVTFCVNAFVQYLVAGMINWVNALVVTLVVTAVLPFFMKKKK